MRLDADDLVGLTFSLFPFPRPFSSSSYRRPPLSVRFRRVIKIAGLLWRTEIADTLFSSSSFSCGRTFVRPLALCSSSFLHSTTILARRDRETVSILLDSTGFIPKGGGGAELHCRVRRKKNGTTTFLRADNTMAIIQSSSDEMLV